MKHAFLLLIHEDTYVVRTLLRMLDDERNDIFIHIDKKSTGVDPDVLASVVKHSRVSFVKREKVYWGHISLVAAEYNLFSAAYESPSAPYGYYHLLSGADLPLKTQDEMHRFFDASQGREYISFTRDEMPHRAQYRWLFSKNFRGFLAPTRTGRRIFRLEESIQRVFIRFQEAIGWKNRAFPLYRKGSEWVSLTHESVGLLLRYRKRVLRCLRLAKCPDEHFKHTILYLYSDTVRRQYEELYEYLVRTGKNADVSRSSCRFIPWGTGSLNLTLKDWDRLSVAPDMFCRKVADDRLAERIYEKYGPESK